LAANQIQLFAKIGVTTNIREIIIKCVGGIIIKCIRGIIMKCVGGIIIKSVRGIIMPFNTL